MKVTKLTDVLAFFVLREWEFTNGNVKKLWNELSVKDKEEFPFDIKKVDWETYHINQLYGIRKYVLKEDLATLPAARRKYFRYTNQFGVCLKTSKNFCFRLKLLHRTLQLILVLLCGHFLYYTIRRFL